MQFTLKDGRTVFGILLEYVTPSERKLKEQSEVAQTAFVRVNYFASLIF
jgi:hypothetical protein